MYCTTYQVLWRSKALAQLLPCRNVSPTPSFILHSHLGARARSKMPLRERARQAHKACISEYAAHVLDVWLTGQSVFEYMRLTLSGKRIRRRRWSDVWRTGLESYSGRVCCLQLLWQHRRLSSRSTHKCLQQRASISHTPSNFLDRHSHQETQT
jgi:hypothetical protein